MIRSGLFDGATACGAAFAMMLVSTAASAQLDPTALEAANSCSVAKLIRYASTTCEPVDQVVELSFKACATEWEVMVTAFAGPKPPDGSPLDVAGAWLARQRYMRGEEWAGFRSVAGVMAIDTRSRAGICRPR